MAYVNITAPVTITIGRIADDDFYISKSLTTGFSYTATPSDVNTEPTITTYYDLEMNPVGQSSTLGSNVTTTIKLTESGVTTTYGSEVDGNGYEKQWVYSYDDETTLKSEGESFEIVYADNTDKSVYTMLVLDGDGNVASKIAKLNAVQLAERDTDADADTLPSLLTDDLIGKVPSSIFSGEASSEDLYYEVATNAGGARVTFYKLNVDTSNLEVAGFFEQWDDTGNNQSGYTFFDGSWDWLGSGYENTTSGQENSNYSIIN